jgi:hypothetical protein
MKLKVLMALAVMGVAMADLPQVWMTQHSVLQWDAPVDSLRTGWNVALVNSLTPAANMPANDAARAADTGNTNGVIRWMVLSDPNVTRLDAKTLLAGVNWQNGNLFVSARDTNGNYSDWVGIQVYNPNPSNVRLK